MEDFEDLDVPACDGFGAAQNSNFDETYFERHQSSPCRSTRSKSQSRRSTESKAAVVEHKCESRENEEPEERETGSPKRRLSNFKVKYQYKYKNAAIPKTPKLRTLARARRPIIDTPNTRIVKELEQLQKNQFKATKLDRNVFKPPIPPVLSHKHTTPHEPTLLTRSRTANSRENVDQEFDKENKFQANPVPNYDELCKLGVYQHHLTKGTTPKSPAFSLTRARSLKLTGTPVNEIKKHYHPAPKFGSPFRPAKANKVTKVESFSFEGRELRKKYVNTCNAESSDGEPCFKAKPAPHKDERPFVPRRNLIPPTKPRESLIPHAVNQRMEQRHEFDREFTTRSQLLEKQRQVC